MKLEGGCYCGAIRYVAEGDPIIKLQCHCRECQYITGGMPNVILGMPESRLTYTKGRPTSFQRNDLPSPVTREFCAECGTHLVARPPGLPGAVMIKVGTLDRPDLFGSPAIAIFTADKQRFHHISETVRAFVRLPG
jgi:hypothetical protein